MSTMDCDICCRPASSRLPFNCITCARNIVYESRLLHAQVLLQKEALGKDIEHAVAIRARTDSSRLTQKNSQRYDASPVNQMLLERLNDEQIIATERTQNNLQHIKALREEITQFKLDLVKRKKSLTQRKAALNSAKRDLARHQVLDLEPIQTAITKTEHRSQALQTMVVEARIFLCKEVANLYGLQHRKMKKGEVGRDRYIIGGNPIIDLRDINNADPTHVTVMITHLAHLIHLTSHYLSLRLPAEITLPSAKHPYPTISSPLSSYLKPSLPTPILAKSSSTSFRSTPTTTRLQPHPRPLHLDKPLHTLAKEDPVAYSLFVDAITLLAWNIAWVCKSQGLDIGVKSWEDVCAIGRNMWLLLVSPPTNIRPAPPSRTTSTTVSQNATKLIPSKSQFQPPNSSLPPPVPSANLLRSSLSTTVTLAYFTHSSSRHFLAGAEGAEYMDGWKLANPIRVIERVKAALASERMGAEWEYLEDDEWNDGGGKVAGTGQAEDAGEGGKGKGVAAGTSGWTKLKRRDGDGG